MSTNAETKPRRGRVAPLNAVEQLEAEQFNGSTVKEAFTSIDALLERREGINAEIKAEKAKIKRMGVPSEIVNRVYTLRNMDAKKRAKADFWMRKMREACDLPEQLDIETSSTH